MALLILALQTKPKICKTNLFLLSKINSSSMPKPSLLIHICIVKDQDIILGFLLTYVFCHNFIIQYNIICYLCIQSPLLLLQYCKFCELTMITVTPELSLIYYTRDNIYYTDSSNFNQLQNIPPSREDSNLWSWDLNTTALYRKPRVLSTIVQKINVVVKKIGWQFLKYYCLKVAWTWES